MMGFELIAYVSRSKVRSNNEGRKHYVKVTIQIMEKPRK